ncbi:hypothetical protein V6O07_18345, partial [Arthrospira platensis SPKY2]
LESNGFKRGQIDSAGLQWMIDKLLKAGHVDQLKVEGLKEDRRPVIAGGLSILKALFDLFDLDTLMRAEGALRQGALYDLIDRGNDQTDVRERTVRWLAERF